MYLSNRDLRKALAANEFICSPNPVEIDRDSIDLHLDEIKEAKVWNITARNEASEKLGLEPGPLRLGIMRGGKFQTFSSANLIAVPTSQEPEVKVYQHNNQITIRPGGFFLWQTRETVGTPEIEPRYICFVNGRSTPARFGLLIHITAPTIHAGWWGKITLEIANLGPYELSLSPGDSIAQIVVACLTSIPLTAGKIERAIAIGQEDVGGHKS